MGIFNKLMGHKETSAKVSAPEPQAPAIPAPTTNAPTPGGISLVKTGKLSLVKGESVTIANKKITARCLWPSTTDYDVYALVLMEDGSTKVVSTFGSEGQRHPTDSILHGAVRHLGDVQRGDGSMAEESIEITFTDDMVAVAPIVYSAQSNGGGSFKKHKVICEISNGSDTTVTINPKEADSHDPSANNGVYTVAVGLIARDSHGINISALELYSRQGSENRPDFVNGKVVMDAGYKNLYK